MILRPCLRQRSAFANLTRPVLSVRYGHVIGAKYHANNFQAQTLIAQQQCQARSIHAVPKVNAHDESFKQDGIPGLLTPEAYNIAWTEYEGHMVDRLNTMLAGTISPSSLPRPYTPSPSQLTTSPPSHRRRKARPRPQNPLPNHRPRPLPSPHLQPRQHGTQQPLLLLRAESNRNAHPRRSATPPNHLLRLPRHLPQNIPNPRRRNLRPRLRLARSNTQPFAQPSLRLRRRQTKQRIWRSRGQRASITFQNRDDVSCRLAVSGCTLAGSRQRHEHAESKW